MQNNKYSLCLRWLVGFAFVGTPTLICPALHTNGCAGGSYGYQRRRGRQSENGGGKKIAAIRLGKFIIAACPRQGSGNTQRTPTAAKTAAKYYLLGILLCCLHNNTLRLHWYSNAYLSCFDTNGCAGGKVG